MNNTKFKSLTDRFILSFLLLISALVIHSCRKDLRTAGMQTTLSTDDIGELQAIYSKGLVSGSPLTTAAANGAHFPNLINGLNVKWDKYVINNRADNSQVFEFDLKTDSSLYMTKPTKAGDSVYYTNRTSAVFIKQADGTRLNFFMKVIEDFSKTHLSVMGTLHYRQIPAAFTGVIIYYTFDRKFINGARYYQGRLITAIGSVPAAAGNLQVASRLKANQMYGGDNGDGDFCGGYTNIYYLYNCEWNVNLETYMCDGELLSQIPDPPCDEGGGPAAPSGEQQDHGGGGANGGSTPDTTTKKIDTCALKDKVIKIQTNKVVDSLNNQVETLAGSNHFEYGAPLIVSNLSDIDTYILKPTVTDHDSTTVHVPVYWNSTDGYSLGFTHSHLFQEGPSPDDVFSLIGNLLNGNGLSTASTTEKALYKANAFVNVMNPAADYQVHITDWDGIMTEYNKWIADKKSYDQNFHDIGQGQIFSSEYSLLTLLGNYITLFKANAGTHDYKPWTLIPSSTIPGKKYAVIEKCPN